MAVSLPLCKSEWRCRESNPGPNMLTTNVYERSWHPFVSSKFRQPTELTRTSRWVSLGWRIGVTIPHLELTVGPCPLSREDDKARDLCYEVRVAPTSELCREGQSVIGDATESRNFLGIYWF